jgi:hypothetical protein
VTVVAAVCVAQDALVAEAGVDMLVRLMMATGGNAAAEELGSDPDNKRVSRVDDPKTNSQTPSKLYQPTPDMLNGIPSGLSPKAALLPVAVDPTSRVPVRACVCARVRVRVCVRGQLLLITSCSASRAVACRTVHHCGEPVMFSSACWLRRYRSGRVSHRGPCDA